MNKKFIQQIQCLVTFLFMLVLTAVPNEARSQTPVKVTLSLKNVRMQAVMNEIEKQTKYLFVTQQDVDLNRIVSVEVRDRALSEALDQMTAGSGVEYVVKAPSIILSVKKAAEPASVSGVVRDAAGRPIIGAAVLVRGTTTGVSTDGDGAFTLQVPPPRNPHSLKSIT